jgi:hypothetical protein
MIIIEIKNVAEIVRRERGFLTARLGPYFADLEAEVERSVILEIQAAFARRGVEASIVSMRGVKLRYPDPDPDPAALSDNGRYPPEDALEEAPG